jgi:hypothetical protein
MFKLGKGCLKRSQDQLHLVKVTVLDVPEVSTKVAVPQVEEKVRVVVPVSDPLKVLVILPLVG